MRIIGLLLCLPLRLTFLLFLELRFLQGGHTPLDSPLPPTIVFERYKTVNQDHEHSYSYICRQRSWWGRDIIISQLQAQTTLYGAKDHQGPAIPRICSIQNQL